MPFVYILRCADGSLYTGIATDLHDDIGASLTRIAILSEVVKSRLGGSRPELLPPLAQVAEVPVADE